MTKLKNTDEKQGDDWAKKLLRILNDSKTFDEMEIRTTSFIRQLEKQTRESVIEEIRRWTKGKDVTKDKLRNHLNQLKQKTKE